MKILLAFSLLLLSHIQLSAANRPAICTNNVVIEPNPGLSVLISMKTKELQQFIGRKLTLKEKIGFILLKQRVKKHGVATVEKQIKDKGKTSFILGLIGLIGLIIPGLGLLSLPIAIIAIIVGNKSKKIDPKNKKAQTGIILGLITIGLILVIASIVVLVIALPVG